MGKKKILYTMNNILLIMNYFNFYFNQKIKV